MKVTEKLIKELQAKHGSIMVIDTEDDDYIVFLDPLTRLDYAKGVVVAFNEKGLQGMVDSLVNNCWLAGDESLKENEAFKSGLEDEIKDLVDIPEAKQTSLENGNVLLSYQEYKIEITRPTRQQVMFAQQRNQANVPFKTEEYLLPKVAVTDTKDLIKDVPAYIAILVSLDKARKKKKLSVKKYSSRQGNACKKTTKSK